MRWSLILSSFVVVQSAFELGCLALVIPPSSEQLERRAGAKSSSKDSREAAKKHPNAYYLDKPGGSTRESLGPADRLDHGRKALMIPHTDADHVFEIQMLYTYLAEYNLKFEQLDPNVQEKVKSIMNGPGNMAPVPAGVNRGKGQVIKHGMKGKAISPKEPRDGYTLLSYPTARETAQAVYKALKEDPEHGHLFEDETLHHRLRNTMNNARILEPGAPSPEGSSNSASGSSVAGSSKGGSLRAHRTPVVSQKIQEATRDVRRSFRIAVMTAVAASRSTHIAGKGKK